MAIAQPPNNDHSIDKNCMIYKPHYLTIEKQTLRKLYPCDIPEIIASPFTQGPQSYLNWIASVTQP
jgi:uncharacterized protein involved in tolerance to divalent cations